MLATASLQMSTNALVAQAFVKHVAANIVCPLMANPLIQGFVLKWFVQNVLFNGFVVNMIDSSLSFLGPIRGLMSWWMKMGGSELSFKDMMAQMKEKFGSLSV